MKIQRKIKEMLKGKGMVLWNPCYFLNLRDAKLTWEERKALLYLFEHICLDATPKTEIFSGIEFDEDTPGEVEYFCLYYEADDYEDYRQLYVFNYYTGTHDKYYVEDLVKKYGSHWGSFKAGLRAWYDHMLLKGEADRKPTNYKSVAV